MTTTTANGQFECSGAACRRAPPLTDLWTASVFRSEGNRSDFRQARHRNLSKPGTEAIEPTLDADRSDRKVANRGVVNPFEPGVPRGNARRREHPFAPQPPGDERGQMKADRLFRIEIWSKAITTCLLCVSSTSAP